jgi:hypothetical protein
MKKMQALYDYLLGTGLVTTEQLHVIVTEGSVFFPIAGLSGGNVTFTRRYTAQININDYAGDIDKLDVALVWWLGLYQPELVGDGGGYGFEAEIISKEIVSLYALVNLSENVRWDDASKTMHNCVQPVIFDELMPLNIPAFLTDVITGEVLDG